MESNTNGQKNFCLYDAAGDIEKNWFVYWYENGKRIRKYGKINRETTEEGRREAAQKFIKTLEREYVPPPPNAAQKKDLYATLWKLEPMLRRKSFQTYKWKLNHLFDALGEREVTKASIKWYFDKFLANSHPTTRNDRLRQLHRLFSLSGLEHLLKGIEVAKTEQTPLRYFQPYQVKQLMSIMEERDPELWLWCRFVFYCFLRPRSELRLMKVSDIYFEERKILVRGDIAKNKKTNYVAIPDAFYPDLERLMERPPNSYIFKGKEWQKPTGYNTMGRRHRILLRELGYGSEYAVYSWKHTGAVMAVRSGIGLKELQMQLRHYSLDQVNAYLRQLNITDFSNLRKDFPRI